MPIVPVFLGFVILVVCGMVLRFVRWPSRVRGLDHGETYRVRR